MDIQDVQDTISTVSSETEQAIERVLYNLRIGIFCKESGIQLQLPQDEQELLFFP